MKSRANVGRAARGFTLIELMIVVSVMGALMVVGVPSMKSFIDEARVDAIATELATDMALAKSTAAAQNCDVALTAKTGGWSAGWQVTYKTNNVTVASFSNGSTSASMVLPQCDPAGANTIVVKDHEAPSGAMTVAPKASTPTSAQFGFDRRLVGSTAPYVLIYPSSNASVRTRCVTVSATGRISSTVATSGSRTTC